MVLQRDTPARGSANLGRKVTVVFGLGRPGAFIANVRQDAHKANKLADGHERGEVRTRRATRLLGGKFGSLRDCSMGEKVARHRPDSANAVIALRIFSGSPGHAATTACNPLSAIVGEPTESCSEFSAFSVLGLRPCTKALNL